LVVLFAADLDLLKIGDGPPARVSCSGRRERVHELQIECGTTALFRRLPLPFAKAASTAAQQRANVANAQR